MTRRQGIRGLLGLAALAGCGDPVAPGAPTPITALPRDLSEAEVRVIAGSNAFAFDFLRALIEHRDGANVITSPLSASMAFGMAMNGAAGETWTQMRDVLGFEGMTEERINEAYRDLTALLLDLDPAVTFGLANSVWAREGLPVLPDFAERLRTHFDAPATTLDFSDPAARDVINGWVADATEGRIEELLETIPPDMVMYLINAIYFKGDWRSRFDAGRTVHAPFTTLGGAAVQVPMMTGSAGFRTAYVHATAIVELPYGGDAFTAVAVLPPAGEDAAAFAAGLTADTWADWMAALEEQAAAGGSAEVRLPRFELEWKSRLNDAMVALGMSAAFDPWSADLSRITGVRDLFIQEAVQQTFLKVDEVGTEAAAATSVGVGVVSLPPTISFDRPFVFAIRERLSGTILFLGLIGDPRA